MGETGAKLPFERKGKGMREREISDFKERAEHGDVLMPIRRYRCIVPNTYQDLSLHWHEEAEIGWIQEGEIDYDINFESFRVRKGDLLLIAPHILHAAHAVPGKRMVSESLVFHLDMLGYQTPDACTIRCISPLQNGKYRFVPVVHSGQPGYGELIACMEELLGCMQPREDAVPKAEEPAEELYRKELLFRLFRLLYRYGYVVKNESGREDFAAEEKMKQVLTFIRSHYAEALTVGQLAGLCHFSETYFMSFFKRFAGMSLLKTGRIQKKHPVLFRGGDKAGFFKVADGAFPTLSGEESQIPFAGGVSDRKILPVACMDRSQQKKSCQKKQL